MVLDVAMPRLDGFEAPRRIKKPLPGVHSTAELMRFAARHGLLR